jgi:DNA gyrase subunit A
MIVTTQGTFIRTPVETISVIGRNTQGVRLIKLGEEELVSSVDKITVSEDIDKDEPPADGEADSGSGREEPSEDGAPGTESAGPEEADERLEDEGEEENGDMAGDWESALLDKSKPK